MPWMAPAAIVGSSLLSADSANSAADKQAGATDRAAGVTDRQYNQNRADLAPYRAAGQSALARLQTLLGLPGGIDESSQEFKSIYDPMVKQFDQAHTDRFGMSIYDPRADAAGVQSVLERLKTQAKDQLGPTTTSTNPQDSPLLRKFTSADLNSDPVYNSGLEFGLDEGRKAIERRAAAGGSLDSGGTLKALTRFGNDYGTTKAEGAYGRFVGNQGDVYGRLSGIAGMGQGATNVGVNAGSASSSNLANLYSGLGNAQAAAGIAGANAVSGGVSNAANYYSQQNLLQQLQGGGARTTPKFDSNLIGPD